MHMKNGSNMNKQLVLCAAVGTTLLLSGCASVGNAAEELWNWDIRKPQGAAQPISSRAAPLSVPPDFALTPAIASAPRPQDGGQEQMLEALFGGPAPRSASERALSGAAGTAEAGIRSSVGDPQTNTVNKGSITRDIIAAPEGDGQTAQAVIPG
jgi:hypothetical protein